MFNHVFSRTNSSVLLTLQHQKHSANVSSHKVITSCFELLSYRGKEKNPQTMLNVDFESHVASKSELPLPAITIIMSLFVWMRMLLLVCI